MEAEWSGAGRSGETSLGCGEARIGLDRSGRFSRRSGHSVGVNLARIRWGRGEHRV